MDHRVSVAGTVAAALRFPAQRPLAILRLAVIPLGLGWVTLYFALDAYLAQLSLFLHQPSAQVGSLALGLIAGGLFLALLLHCVLVIGLTETALDRPRASNWFFRVGLSEWRLYAAHLRVLLLSAVAIGAPAIAAWGVARVLGQGTAAGWASAIAYVVMMAGLAAIAVRIGFLMAPIVVLESGSVLRRSLVLSREISLRLLAIILLCTIPGIVVQSVAETVSRHIGLLPPVVPYASFATLVATLRLILPEFVTITTAAYFATLSLLVGAAASVYRTRMERAASES
jgi:hypothetical protein